MADKRPALGKGLSALIPDAPEPRPATVEADIDLITPSRHQPRSRAADARLETLAASIKANGIIQPIIVRRVDRGFQIIAGERRWRAAQLAGLHRVPVTVRDVPAGNDGQLLELALIENIQRENLNPIEEASAYRRLLDEFHLTQERIAEAVGKDRASVANFLRLLRLPDEVRQAVAAGQLSMGHARAILGLEDAEAARRAAREVVRRGLSVRATEALVRRQTGNIPAQKAATRSRDVHVRAAEEKLSIALGARTRIVRRRRGGTIEIAFGNESELQRLYERLTQR
jgi:ParB family chromosome partitioning protein